MQDIGLSIGLQTDPEPGIPQVALRRKEYGERLIDHGRTIYSTYMVHALIGRQ